MAHILLIGAFRHILEVADTLGVVLTVFLNPGDDLCEHTHVFQPVVRANYNDRNVALTAAIEIHKRHPIDAVVSFEEFGLEAAGTICDALGVRGNPYTPQMLSRNKVEMRRRMALCNFPSPPFKECHNPEELLQFWASLKGPVVVKPAGGVAKIGVMSANSPEELQKAWQGAKDACLGSVLAEQLIEGPEVLAVLQSFDGRHELVAIEEMITTEAPYFIEHGHATPLPLAPDTHSAIEAAAYEFLDLIGHQTGPTHLELRLTSSGPLVIECNARPAGDFSWEMTLRAHGVDLFKETLEYLSSGRTSPRVKGTGGAAVLFFIHNSCKVQAAEGLEEAAALPGVIRVCCTVKSGDILPLLSNQSRPGYVFAIGRDYYEALTSARKAYDLVRFTTEPYLFGHP